MEIIGWLVLGVICIMVVVYVYIFGFKDKSDYKKARVAIFAFVGAYKKRCNGNNRFVVTIETLQDSFREYDTTTITNVWLELIKERVIEQDLQDNEWCVRK